MRIHGAYDDEALVANADMDKWAADRFCYDGCASTVRMTSGAVASLGWRRVRDVMRGVDAHPRCV
ncbi:hypothetical protein ASF47_04385 [Nocardioides sp. Leaf285]|nr:hypothetical protein ASF47_04385 [Nocardioides sp. Leaf285]